MATVLAVDVGSSLAKAQRFDHVGRGVGPLHRRQTGFGANGRADAEALASGIEELIDAVAGDDAPVDAVAISTAWHTLVGVDGRGVATTQFSTWVDPLAGPEAAELRRGVADERDVHDRTGAPIHPSLPSARILWLARHDTDAYAATERWCSLPEFLASRWFGKRVGPSSSIASATGLYDQRRQEWDAEVLELLSVAPTALAPVDDEPRRGLGAAYAARWPALAEAPWFPAVGDGACAVVGSGCTRAGRAALTVGTSAAVRVLTDRATRFASPLPPALFGYLLDGDRCIVGAARSSAGNVVAWARAQLGLDDAGVAAAMAAPCVGAHGLHVEGSLVLERSPHWPLATEASIAGIRPTTTAGDVLQALVEHAAAGVADAIGALEAWSGPQELVAGGGALESEGWRRLLADAVGRPLLVSSEREASARGAALLALERLGAVVSDAPEDLGDAEMVEPDAERAAAFRKLRMSRAASPFAASLGA